MPDVRCPDCLCQITAGPGEAPDCSGCEERRAACGRCEDCRDLLCADCLAAHRTVLLTRDHKISQLQSQPRLPAFCSLHEGQELCLYCHFCQKLFCRQCRLRADLAQRNLDLELKSAEIQESINSIDHSLASQDSDEESLLHELIQVKVAVIGSIANRQQELIADLSQVSSQRKKTLENRCSHLSRTLDQTKTAINLLSDLTNSSSSAEKMMLMKETMSRQVTRLEQANTSVGQIPPSQPDLQFGQWRGRALDRNLAAVVRMVMEDLVMASGDQQHHAQSDHFSPHRQEGPDRTSKSTAGPDVPQPDEREEINQPGEASHAGRKRKRAGSVERPVSRVEDNLGVNY